MFCNWLSVYHVGRGRIRRKAYSGPFACRVHIYQRPRINDTWSSASHGGTALLASAPRGLVEEGGHMRLQLLGSPWIQQVDQAV